MYHYLYTNDMRVSNLEEKAVEFSKMFLTDTVPTAEEDKSINNSAQTIGFYLNLTNKGNSALLAAQNDVRGVILNFIKTFQFPNSRTKGNFNDTIDDKIQVAPLREIIKLLFLFQQMDKDSAYLSVEEILSFIFYNDAIAKSSSPDRVAVIKEIIEFRKSKKLGSNIASLTNRSWKHQDRQIKELLSILSWSKFVDYSGDKITLILDMQDDDIKYKSELLDIITFDEFWDYEDPDKKFNELRTSYFDYVDSWIPQQKDYINPDDIEHHKCNSVIQKLYFGAPGTGKSFDVSKLIKECYPSIEEKDNPYVFKTTVFFFFFYYNFVGNIMPVSRNGEIGYDFQPGIFTQALAMALNFAEKDIFLIVEEMTRGNIASIFGDLFQLLDRDKFGISEYSINNDLISHYFERKAIDINKIYLPLNLHIIGTINTSDQNVNVMDTAFKRRFDLIYVDVEPVRDRDSNELLNTFVFTFNDGKEFEWNKLYLGINEFIIEKLKLSEDKQLGQFFIKFDNYKNDTEKYESLQNKLLHYLWSDVQGAAMLDDFSIFKEDFSSFSKLYKAFGNNDNVFSEDFIEIYDSTVY